MIARIVEHRAPTGDGREHAQTKEAKSGFGENRAGHTDRGLDQNRLKNIGEQVAQLNAEAGSAERLSGQNKFQFLHFEDLRAGNAGVPCPAGEDEGEDDFADTWSKERSESDGQQNTGK